MIQRYFYIEVYPEKTNTIYKYVQVKCISKCFENAQVHVRITWQKFRKPFQEQHSELRNPPFCGPSRTINLVTKVAN